MKNLKNAGPRRLSVELESFVDIQATLHLLYAEVGTNVRVYSEERLVL